VPTVISDGPHDSTIIVVIIAKPANNNFFIIKEFKLTILPLPAGMAAMLIMKFSITVPA
jgi:hypothetical protein